MMAIPFTWDGESMVPRKGWAKRADELYTIGEDYTLVEEQSRSPKSHAHYFACVGEAWKNLPERLQQRFPTSEHLRKYALIKSGYGHSRTLVASSRAEALRIAAFLKPADEYALVVTDGATVTEWTAESQSLRAMGRERFQASKTAVLDCLASLLGTSTGAIDEAARNAA